MGIPRLINHSRSFTNRIFNVTNKTRKIARRQQTSTDSNDNRLLFVLGAFFSRGGRERETYSGRAVVLVVSPIRSALYLLFTYNYHVARTAVEMQDGSKREMKHQKVDRPKTSRVVDNDIIVALSCTAGCW